MIKFIFFSIFYVILGTAGVTIPMPLNGFIINDVSIGLITIAISTAGYASTEKVLQLYGNKQTAKFEVIVNISAIVVFLLLTAVVAIGISKNWCSCISLSISAFIYILSCVLWWYQNRDNENLVENTNAIGGSTLQFNE